MKHDSRNDFPACYPITRIVQENPETKTFFLDCAMDAKPGQFVMLWLPGIDEKPMSVCYAGKQLGVTVLVKGKATSRMAKLRKGDWLGVRGPYGNAFAVGKTKRACLVGGGVGVPPLAFLCEALARRKIKYDFVMGARTKNGLMLESRVKKHGKLYVTTNDGSKGFKGFTTDKLAELLAENRYDVVYTCGPEIMMKKVFDLCEQKRVPVQAALERYFKCGFGICGQCCLDESLVCWDGPVYGSAFLRRSKEFGVCTRAKSGKRISLNEWMKKGM